MIEDWIALSLVRGIGEWKMKLLVNHFGSPSGVFKATVTELASAGINREVACNIKNFRDTSTVNRHLSLIEKFKIELITFLDENYPANLTTLEDAPPLLYVSGEIKKSDKFAIALIGSRKATVYGKLMTEKLATGLVKNGLAIVSGMARGIDTVAHTSALKAGGRTIAVLGCGLDVVYPPENKRLEEQIIENGAVVSEFPMGTKPLAGNFPTRNRIISGLSMGVVVVEAGKNSGVFSTARCAAEQGREVFAVPGNVSSKMSVGTNILIKEGAKVVLDLNDILEELHLERAKETERVIPELAQDEETVYNVLTAVPKHIDEISSEVGYPVSKVLSILFNLEMKELVRQSAGKLFVKQE